LTALNDVRRCSENEQEWEEISCGPCEVNSLEVINKITSHNAVHKLKTESGDGYPTPSQVPQHKNVWGSGDIAQDTHS
jgi:hypothetical protein